MGNVAVFSILCVWFVFVLGTWELGRLDYGDSITTYEKYVPHIFHSKLGKLIVYLASPITLWLMLVADHRHLDYMLFVKSNE